MTVEDPVEFQVKGFNQVNIRSEFGLSFPAALRSILRQDPDVILIGEIRDSETLDIAVKAALTGHLVVSSLAHDHRAGIYYPYDQYGDGALHVWMGMTAVLRKC